MRYSPNLLLAIAFFFSSSAFALGTGTGFFISANGYLATNYHVVAGAQDIAVLERMDKISRARVVQVDANNDLALLKIEGEAFPFLPIAPSSQIQKGETVFTVGFPNVDLQGMEAKVTQGIVSSLSGIRGQPNELQISVPVQPGNSGGPLVDERGNVVGVVVAKLAPGATLQSSGSLPENVNYAVKSNYLLELVATLPAVKSRILMTQSERKLTLPKLIEKTEPAVVMVIVSTEGPLSLLPPKTAQGKQSPVPGNQKPQPQPPKSLAPIPEEAPRMPEVTRPPVTNVAPTEPEGPTKNLCAENFSEYGRGNFDGAFEKIKPLAQQGNSIAQLCLGRMYDFGNGVQQSDSEAVKWYRLSAEQGNAAGQNSLGVKFVRGKGVPQSDSEAVKWYRLSAEQGNSLGQYNLGFMYEIGRGVPQSDSEAVKWFRLSAEQGYDFGQLRLGLMYAHGKGVAKSDSDALNWYRLSAEQGNAVGQGILGDRYKEGEGVSQSDSEAVKWYRLSAESGNANGQNSLGWMYEKGKGVPQSDNEAVKWYRLSAEQGNAGGQNSLGLMYEKGRGGLSQSYAIAIKWYRLAAEQGEAFGELNLGIMYADKKVLNDRGQAVYWLRRAAKSKDNHEAARTAKNTLAKMGEALD